MAAAVTAANKQDHQIGGRPMAYPNWCLMLFGACIRIYGSASGRAFQGRSLWAAIKETAADVLG